VRRFGEDLGGRRFALWGLAFKPETDDMREAPSRVLVAELVRRGAEVRAYDPVAMGEAKKVFAGLQGISYSKQAMEAVQGADALVIATEWKEFRSPDFDALRAALRQPVVFDGRNLFSPEVAEAAGIEYHAIGRRTTMVWTDCALSTEDSSERAIFAAP
jgi:UDPglucose 6-dehydrogenase